jgi:MFS family permease
MAFSLLTWLSAFFMRSRGIAEDKAGMLLGIISLMAVIGAPLGGIVADIWQKKSSKGRMYLAAVADASAAAAILVAFSFDLQGIGFAFALAWCFFTMAAMPSLMSVTQDVVTPGLKSMAWGMAVFVMYVLGGGWAPALVGVISDGLGGGAHGLKVALMIMSLGGFAGGALFLIGSRHYPADHDKVKHHTLEGER